MAIAVASVAREYALGVESLHRDATFLFKDGTEVIKEPQISYSIQKTQLATERTKVNPCRSF
jgi:hypothetical protein